MATDVAGYFDLYDVSSALRIYARNKIYHQFSNTAPIMYALLPSVTNEGFNGLQWDGTLHTGRNLSFGGLPEGGTYFYGDRPHEKYGKATWDVVSTYIHLRMTAHMIARAGQRSQHTADDMVAQEFRGASDSLLRLEHFEMVRGNGTGRLATITLDDDGGAGLVIQVDDYRMIEVDQRINLVKKTGVQVSAVSAFWKVTAVSKTFIPYSDATDAGGFAITLDVAPGAAMDIDGADSPYYVCTPKGYGEQLFGLLTHCNTANPPAVAGAANNLGGLTRVGNDQWQARTENFNYTELTMPLLKRLLDNCGEEGGEQPNFGVMCKTLWNAIGFGELASQFQTRRERLGINFQALNFFGTRLIADDLVDLPGGDWKQDTASVRHGKILFTNTRQLAYAWVPGHAMGLPIKLVAREVAPGTNRVNRLIEKVLFQWVHYAGPRGGRLVLSQTGHWAQGQIFGWRQLCSWRMNGHGWAQNILL